MTRIDQIEISPGSGVICVRMEKSGGGWHRVTIMPGMEPEKVLASVNAHLVQMGHQEIDSDGWSLVMQNVQALRDRAMIETDQGEGAET